MGKLIAYLRKHYFFILYLGSATIFLSLINPWFWPTPDEYLYANLARAFAEAAQGRIAWADISTEHVSLLSYCSYLYNSILHPQSLLASRPIIFGFALGIITLLYNMGKTLQLSIKQRSWWLWLLLLIPGFWVFSVRLMLDIPATFGMTLVTYLLLKKAPAYQIGLATALLLCLKEYYVYLTLPLFIMIYGVDAWKSHNSTWRKGWLFFKNMTLTYLPTVIITVLLLDFNILPYPRLLENNLVFIFGDAYHYGNKLILIALRDVLATGEHIIATVQHIFPQPQTISTAHILPHATIIDHTPLGTTHQTISSATSLHPSSLSSDLAAKIDTIQLTGNIPSGIIDSPATVVENRGVLAKIWQIYSYNFSEADINIFILPLCGVGLTLSLTSIYRQFKHHYASVRPHFIFLSFFLIFLYFNWHEANSIHGFRVTLPLIISLIFFSYLGLQKILVHWSKASGILFGILSTSSIVLYWLSIRNLQYGSVLAQNSLAGILLTYKPYFFIGLFIILVVVLLLFHQLAWRRKYSALCVIVLGLLVIKFIPFYLNNQQSVAYYGFDYGLETAAPILRKLVKEYRPVMYSNTHPYELQYYAGDAKISNEGIVPSIRTFTKGYRIKYVYFPVTTTFLTDLRTNRVQYVLLIQNTYAGSNSPELEKFIAQYPESFTKVNDSYHNNRLQWTLYKYN